MTGGLNGLGLLTARWLAQSGASYIFCASRRGTIRISDGFDGRAADCHQLAHCHARLGSIHCDTSEGSQVLHLASHLLWATGATGGIWHAAGIVSDRLLPKLNHEVLLVTF